MRWSKGIRTVIGRHSCRGLKSPYCTARYAVTITSESAIDYLLGDGMKTIGFYLAKSQLRYTVLEGARSAPTLVHKERLVTIEPGNVPALMDWFDTQFGSILSQHRPDAIGYRLTLEPNKEQLFTTEFPCGILNLHAYNNRIPIMEYTPQAYVGSKLGLPKAACLFDHCDHVLGSHPPYWDKSQKYSVLAAWFELK